MLQTKLYKYCMSSATKIRVMMDRGDAAARYTNKIKRIKRT